MKTRRLMGAGLPPGVNDLEQRPAQLFLRGRIPPGPRVALVGTRNPSTEAVEFTEQLSFDLARRGVVVLSGGARGIDAAAHRGALAAEGSTLVVAPSSWDQPFPAEHAPLFGEIVMRGGGYISPFAGGKKASTAAFFERNALMVAMSSVVVVTEAPFRSGARNTAAWARRLRRALFVAPAAPYNPRGAGCLLELELGARMLRKAEDVLDHLRAINEHTVEVDRSPTLDAAAATQMDLPLSVLE